MIEQTAENIGVGRVKVAIIGGSLQGIEVCYLARKAGWETILVDRRERAPARNLCDRFIRADATEPDTIAASLKDVDFVMPALENDSALRCLTELTSRIGKPFAFDPDAYAVSSSKLTSGWFFRKHRIPTPSSRPDCDFPLIIKPAHGSGSQGVELVRDRIEWNRRFPEGLATNDWVIEEFLPGPTFSIEVIGHREQVQTFQVTDLHMDQVYDCKRVTAPSVLNEELQAEFHRIATAAGRALAVRGIMDVEVVLNGGRLKVLEIDARFPSQTPTAVYWSSGVNMLEILAEALIHDGFSPARPVKASRGVIYEHIRRERDALTVAGEHVLTEAGPVRIIPDFFGADEAITDYQAGASRWTATLICTGNTVEDAWLRRRSVLQALKTRFDLSVIHDPSPTELT